MDDTEQLDHAYLQVESPSGRMMREIRELHRQTRQQLEMHGDIQFSDGSDGSRAAIFGSQTSDWFVPPSTGGYPWIGSVLDADMSGAYDVAIGDATVGTITTPPAAVEKLNMQIGTTNSPQLSLIMDSDISAAQLALINPLNALAISFNWITDVAMTLFDQAHSSNQLNFQTNTGTSGCPVLSMFSNGQGSIYLDIGVLPLAKQITIQNISIGGTNYWVPCVLA